MQKELHQFDRLKVWELVDKPFGKTVIKLKWLWKNKKDEDNNVIRNKSRLVAKGYRHEEGIDFEESFAPPDGFIDPDHPEKVYRLKKAALRALSEWNIRRPNNISKPTKKHLKEAKRIFRYLKGTINMGLWYPKDSGFELTPFLDADHAGCLDTHKSTSRGKQFIADKLLKDYDFDYKKIPLYCDSQSAIAISCNPVQHSRTKHIAVRYHFIKEQVERGIVELYFVRTEYQLADTFTEALSQERFKYLVGRLCMRCLTPAELDVLANETA
ncbi:retrovirus-related pol polyprotein from transposon TNT 1-94 [Tanacetum coccineum]|uniref:Retrovirus-related pol polyprotein from transposon TNT 1-94 n=1 Tax=Tanacetum coccineum TaxID=301880 RepID=A0ABQ5BFM1_9ASTR